MSEPNLRVVAIALVIAVATLCSVTTIALNKGHDHKGVVHAPSHSTSEYSLLGFPLGEPASKLRTLLGEPRMTLGSNHGTYLVYQSKRYHLWLAFLIHQEQVESIVLVPLKDQRSDFVDSLGLRFGDNVAKLKQKRPNPVAEPPDMLTYNIGNSQQFVYGMRDDEIYAIELTKGAINIPPLLVDFDRNGATPPQALELSSSGANAVAAERKYAVGLPCGRSHWHWISSTRLILEHQQYDVALFGCELLHQRVALYFLLGAGH